MNETDYKLEPVMTSWSDRDVVFIADDKGRRMVEDMGFGQIGPATDPAELILIIDDQHDYWKVWDWFIEMDTSKRNSE